jgi:HNH endonuclease/AP2 domain
MTYSYRHLDPAIVRELLDYRPVSGLLVWKFRALRWFDSERTFKCWNGRYAGTLASSKHVTGYRYVDILGVGYHAHRVAWAHHYGVWPEDEVDHINHNRSDNRIVNLRNASRTTNTQNASKRKDNTSGVTGVSWDRQHQKWAAIIFTEGRNHRLGRFNDFEQAVAAREAAVQKYRFHENHGR